MLLACRTPVESKLLLIAHMRPPYVANPIQRDKRNSVLGLSTSTYVKVALVAALAWVLFSDVLIDMAHDWWTVDAHSQGMLLPPLALYVAWLRREAILNRPIMPDNRGLVLTGFACLVFVFGKLASEYFMMRISFRDFTRRSDLDVLGTGSSANIEFSDVTTCDDGPFAGLVYNSLATPLQLLASDIAARIAQA